MSDYGRVRATFDSPTNGGPAGRLLRPSVRKPRNYKAVRLYYGHEEKPPVTRTVHRLVLEAFIGSRPVGMQCRHLNGDGGDNRLENLRWGTPLENHADKIAQGRTERGGRNVNTKLTEDDVREIRRTLRNPYSARELADRFGVWRETINAIGRGHTWKWLDD